MKKKAMLSTLAVLVLLLSVTAALSGCGRKDDAVREIGPAGIWHTASMAYEADGTMAPEYHVRFTDAEIVYGHLKDGTFAADYADRLVKLEKTAAGGYLIQAEASNGQRYSYQTCESDPSVLEYYESWDTRDFPETYRGGASLTLEQAELQGEQYEQK